MKLSVSVSDDDVAFIDDYAAQHGVASRSAVVQRALSLLRADELREDYAAAFVESADEIELWDSVVGDGVASVNPR